MGQQGKRVKRASLKELSNQEVEVDFYADRGSSNIFLEISKEMDERVRQNSPFRYLRTWRLLKMIVKSNDDVRQEQFAMQLISQMD